MKKNFLFSVGLIHKKLYEITRYAVKLQKLHSSINLVTLVTLFYLEMASFETMSIQAYLKESGIHRNFI